MLEHTASDGSSATADLGEKLDAVKTEWRDVRERAADKASQLREAASRADKFHNDLDTMLGWISLNEEKLSSAASPSLRRDTLTRQLSEAHGLQAELQRKNRDAELIRSEATALADASEMDRQAVDVQVNELGGRWEELSTGMSTRNQFSLLLGILLKRHLLICGYDRIRLLASLCHGMYHFIFKEISLTGNWKCKLTFLV